MSSLAMNYGQSQTYGVDDLVKVC